MRSLRKVCSFSSGPPAEEVKHSHHGVSSPQVHPGAAETCGQFGEEELANANRKPGALKTSKSITPVASATCLNDIKIMVQISLLTNLAAITLPLSKCIKLLENEGVQLISSSKYSTFENRTFCSLHVQVHDPTISLF
jgi:hypothetical protein